MAKGFSDVGTQLYVADITGDATPTSGFEKFIGVRSTSAKGTEPAQLDNTELHETKTSSIADRQETPNQVYTFNHTAENYDKALATTGERKAYLEVLPSGDGHLMIGTSSVFHNGFGGPGSLSESTFTIVCEDIEHLDKTEVSALLA